MIRDGSGHPLFLRKEEKMNQKSIASRILEETQKAKSTMTAETLFRSGEFTEHINNLVSTVTGHYKVRGKSPIRVDLYWAEDPTDTACTEGTTIHQNLNCSLVHCFSSLYNQYLAQIGLTMHECSHILYTNFAEKKRSLLCFSRGEFPSRDPETETLEQEQQLQEMKDALQDPFIQEVVITAYSHLQNISSDAHDEDCLISDSGRFVTEAIETLRYSLWSRCMLQTLEGKMKLAEEKKITKLSLMFDCMLQFVRFQEVAVDNEQAYFTYEPIQKLREIARFVSALRYTDDPKEQDYYHNEILFRLWPYLQEEIEKQKEAGKAMEEISKAVSQILNQTARDSGTHTNAVEKGKTSSIARAMAKAGSSSGKNEAGSASKGSTKGQCPKEESGGFLVLIKQVAQSSAESNVQAQIHAETNAIIQATPANSSHYGIAIHTEKIGAVTPADISLYQKLMKDLLPYSRAIQKEVLRILQDLRDGGVCHHRQFGKFIEISSVYRPDQRFFGKKNLPEDIPELALSILVDHSGSMAGERISASMKAAMLLQDFASALKIPVAVAGHNSSTPNAINYFSYMDFDSISPSEKYRLAKMSASGCNRDGLALEVALNLLSKRPEECRMLFIISDGQPSAQGYGGPPAYEDMRSIVEKYRRKGIETIAFAIGSDKDRIKMIYGQDSFVDISDLNALPKTLVRILRKKIVP